MFIVDEKDLLEAVKNGACPKTILQLFNYVKTEHGLISSEIYPLLPGVKERVYRLRPDLRGKW